MERASLGIDVAAQRLVRCHSLQCTVCVCVAVRCDVLVCGALLLPHCTGVFVPRRGCPDRGAEAAPVRDAGSHPVRAARERVR